MQVIVREMENHLYNMKCRNYPETEIMDLAMNDLFDCSVLGTQYVAIAVHAKYVLTYYLSVLLVRLFPLI